MDKKRFEKKNFVKTQQEVKYCMRSGNFSVKKPSLNFSKLSSSNWACDRFFFSCSLRKNPNFYYTFVLFVLDVNLYLSIFWTGSNDFWSFPYFDFFDENSANFVVWLYAVNLQVAKARIWLQAKDGIWKTNYVQLK